MHSAVAAIESGRSVAICGLAGMGKTTLAQTITTILGRPVLWNAVTRSSASIALGPIAPLLSTASVELARPVEVLATISDALRRQAPESIVVIDDAHLLDQMSAAVVHRIASDGIPVVVTVRSEEDTPDAVEALWNDDLATRIDLGPLGPADVREQIKLLLADSITGDSAARIHHLSGGNPLYVREIVLAGRQDGWLRNVDGRWEAAAGPPPSGKRLSELIGARLRDLGHELTELLELIAVAEKLELAACQHLAPLERVVALEERQLVRVIDVGGRPTVTIDHPIIAEAVRYELGDVKRRLHADRLVAALLGLDLREPDMLLRIGELAAGSTAPDPALLLQAAAAAFALHDFAGAARLAQIAADHGGGVDAALSWADAAAAARQYHDADVAVRRTLAAADLTDEQRVRAVALRANVLMWGFGQAEEAEAVLRAGETQVSDPTLLDIELSFLLMNLGRTDECLALCQQRLDDDRPAVRLRSAAIAANCHALKGAVTSVDALVDRHLPEALEHLLDVPRASFELLVAQILVKSYAGQAPAMREAAQQLVDSAEATGDMALLGPACLMAALAELAQGCLDDGIAMADRALAVFEVEDIGQLASWMFAIRAHLAAIAGDYDDVDRYLARSVQPPFHAFTTFDFDRNMAAVRALAGRGDRHRAVQLALQSAEEMRKVGRDGAEALLLDLASRLGHVSVVDRLQELADRAEGELLPLLAAHASALASGDHDRLLEVAERFEVIGAQLSAADAAAAAARAAWSSDRRSTSAGAAERARSLLAACGTAMFTQPLPTPDLMLDLTERELDIALLAAQGRTNREIADELVLSARTVGNHLYRVYAKAGVDGRVELAGVLRAAGYLR